MFKLSEGVRPTAVVSLYGEYLTGTPAVRFLKTDGSVAATQPAIQTDPGGHFCRVVFPTIPPGAYQLAVQNAAGWSTRPVFVNRAEPRWISEERAYPGLALKLIGRNLDASEYGGRQNTEVRMAPVDGGKSTVIAPADTNPYDIDFTVPKDLPARRYYVEVTAHSAEFGKDWVRLDNHSEFPDTVRDTVVAVEPAPTAPEALALEVAWANDFNWTNVVDAKRAYRASGDGTTDDTLAIQKAIDAVTANGGGVVRLPNGNYRVAGLALTSGCILQGEDRDKTVIAVSRTGGEAIVAKGSRHGIAELTLRYQTQAPNDVQSTLLGGDASQLFLHRVTFDLLRNPDVSVQHSPYYVSGAGPMLVAGCRFFISSRNLWNHNVRNRVTFRDNFIDMHDGLGLCMSSEKLLVLNNELVFHPAPYAGQMNGFFLNEGWMGWNIYNAYIAGNQAHDLNGPGDCQPYAADSAWSCLAGAVTAASPNTVEVRNDMSCDFKGLDTHELEVIVVQGKGLGQLRRVSAPKTLGGDPAVVRFTVSPAWDVPPDATSVVSVGCWHVNNVFFRNQARRAKSPYNMYYGGGYDCVDAEAVSEDTEGWYNWGRIGEYPGKAPWHCPVYFSQLKRSTFTGKSPTYLTMGITLRVENETVRYRGIGDYGTEIRDNTIDRGACSNASQRLAGNAAIAARNQVWTNLTASTPLVFATLCEGNRIKNSAVGFDLNQSYSFAIRGTAYENCPRAVNDNGFDTALLPGAPEPVKPAATTTKLAAEPSGTSVISLDKPFTFSYLAWEGKARITNGVVWLDAAGLTPKGGAGVMANIDLSGHEEDCLALRVRVGPRNTLKTLKLLLRDTTDHPGTWFFALPGPSDRAVQVTPMDGAPLSHPNEAGKDASPALARIMQWQMMGDWIGDGAVDLRVEAILAVKPDAEIQRARTALAARERDARAQAEKDRQAARAQYGRRTANSPRLEAVYAAAPDVLALQIREGKLTPSKLTDYKPQAGDEQNKDHHLIRQGKDLGVVIGPPGRESGLVSGEGFTGDPLLQVEADDAANYRVTSADDPAFSAAATPIKVRRKSKADDWQQFTQAGVVVVHRIYLQLAHPLTAGRTYSVALGQVNTDRSPAEFKFDPDTTWTEAIHINQVGFRPEDPLKQAFLSLWMGNGGACDFPPHGVFHLVDTRTGKQVYTGAVGAAWPADKPEKMADTRNFNGTAVSPIDFSDFKTPGEYRVVVESIGCSYPFMIGPKTWEQAFRVQMKGFFNERSGIELGPPYTDFVRPICWKPGVNDCLPITQSAYSIVDGNPNGKGGLPQGDTGKPVPDAWGGYHDAGDWNPRRIDHMRTTTFWQLELLQLFPEYFTSLSLNVPNDAPGPDLLKECLFELDLFRRLQLPDGSCRFGIETDGDPFGGEVSWKQHMPAFVYAPDIYSSYLFASVAARAAQVLENHDRDLAKDYRERAIHAMQWAEADRERRKRTGTWDRLPNHNDDVHQNRNLAAVCLYALTRDPHWHEVFLEDTVLKTDAAPAFRGNQAGRDAAFTYARLPEGLGEAAVKRNAVRAIVADADGALAYQANNAFGITSDDPGKPHFIGFYSNPHGAVCLVRAHRLTGESKYLAGAIKACLFPAGANPNNLVYTSGVGTHYVKAMNMDAIATGQSPPVGLTPYGNVDLSRWHDNWIVWPITYFIGKHCQPAVFDWPTTEAYFDARFWPALCEFCIDQTMGPSAYVWGYLAARR